MSFNVKTKVGFGVYFQVEKFNVDGDILFRSAKFKNKILNNGLNRIGQCNRFFLSTTATPVPDAIARWINIGTGTSTPTGTQTGLDNFFASLDMRGDSLISKDVLDNPVRSVLIGSKQFDIGTFDGQNIAEVGLSAGNDSNYFNRQLIRVTTEEIDEVIGTGDGTTTNFVGSLTNDMCDPESLVITAYDTDDNLMTVTDDGNGNLIGDVGAGSNIIIYTSGAFDVTFDNPVKSEQTVKANYTWQEPAAITVLADEGLRVFFTVVQYAEMEINDTQVEHFQFEDLTESTAQSIEATKKLVHFRGLDDSTISGIATRLTSGLRTTGGSWVSPNSVNRTLITAAAGGPRLEAECVYNPGTFTGTINDIAIRCSGNSPDHSAYHSGYEISLNPPITDIIDTEELKITVAMEWGEV